MGLTQGAVLGFPFPTHHSSPRTSGSVVLLFLSKGCLPDVVFHFPIVYSVPALVFPAQGLQPSNTVDSQGALRTHRCVWTLF